MKRTMITIFTVLGVSTGALFWYKDRSLTPGERLAKRIHRAESQFINTMNNQYRMVCLTKHEFKEYPAKIHIELYSSKNPTLTDARHYYVNALCSLMAHLNNIRNLKSFTHGKPIPRSNVSLTIHFAQKNDATFVDTILNHPDDTIIYKCQNEQYQAQILRTETYQEALDLLAAAGRAALCNQKETQ